MTLPLLLGIGLALGQVAPLSPRALQRLAPHTLDLKRQLAALSSAGPAATADDIPMQSAAPISLYPAATRLNLALLVLATTMFLLGAKFFSDQRSLLWLCAAVTATGAALALFGIVQQLTWNGKLFWVVTPTYETIPFGPFVNRNNGAGYLNVCLAAALACWMRVMWRRDEQEQEYEDNLKSFEARGRNVWERMRDDALDFISQLDAVKLLVAGAVVLIIAGILFSLSRGGAVTLAGAMLITCLALWLAGRWRGQLLLVAFAAIMAVGLLLWVGRGAAVQQRLGTLLGVDLQADGRVPHWRTSLQAVRDFPWLGSGLGTYKFIYPLYDHQAAVAWFYHAENQYIEALVEAGVCGLALLLIAIALMACDVWRLFARGKVSGDFMAAVLGLYALSSQAIASCFDFGLYTPATMVLFALITGAVAGRAAQTSGKARWPEWTRPRGLPPLLLALLLVGSVQGFREFRGFAALEAALKESNNLKVDPGTSRESVSAKADALRRSLHARWDDAEGQQQLAHLLMQQYRLQIYHQLAEQYPEPELKSQLWLLASPLYLHRRVHELIRAGNTAELAALRERPEIVRYLESARAHLLLSRQACPLLSEAHLDLAEISAALTPTGSKSEAADMERARFVAPSSMNGFYRTGLLDSDAQHIEAAIRSWRRSLELSSTHLDGILLAARQHLTPQQLVDEVLPSSTSILVTVVRLQQGDPTLAEERELVLAKAQRALESEGLPTAEAHYWRGAIRALQGDYQAAIEEYLQAIRLRPSHTPWRYELALMYADRDMWDEAHEQAQWCARLAPRLPEIRALLERIHQARSTGSP
ncbi:MAG: O-antigen ligase family protein [Planctomycetes bacterium]|nr:O-antigen ligase family protein [Planctomycetota bacterium]